MKRAARALLFILVLAGAGAAAWHLTRQAKGGEAADSSGRRGDAGPVPVLLATVATRDFPIYFDGIGTVQAFNSVTIRARVDGQLESVAFREGQEVRKGDLLATIDPRPYKAALDQATARKAQDEAQLDNAKATLHRNTTLLQQRVLDNQTFDTQKFLVAQLAAAVAADQAAIDSAQTQLDYTRITAPIDGRAGVRLLDAGNLVRSSDSAGLVVINQIRPITVSFNLPERDLPEIQSHIGKEPLKVIALDRSNSMALAEGELGVVDNQIDQQTGTVRLKATFPNGDLSLWPGQFVNARLLVTTRRDALVVPAAVVQQGPNGAFVYAVDDQKNARMRPVTAGPTEGGITLIEAGLKAGERVVADGQYKLQEGSKIEDVPRGMPQGSKPDRAPEAE
ncbi:MAG: efflux RND transporter periplasmic adaptor subunit [Verrucomicrobiae bacterium]